MANKSQLDKLESSRKTAWRSFYEKQNQLMDERKHYRELINELKAKLEILDKNRLTLQTSDITGLLDFVQRELGDIKSKLTCPICQEESFETNQVVITKCAHCFCSDCFKPWIKNNKNCPVCRTDLSLITKKEDSE